MKSLLQVEAHSSTHWEGDGDFLKAHWNDETTEVTTDRQTDFIPQASKSLSSSKRAKPSKAPARGDMAIEEWRTGYEIKM